MIYVKSINKKPGSHPATYPFSTSLICQFEEFTFTHPVTIFCGDNGSGKTSFMEILAERLSSIRIDTYGKENEKRKMIEKSTSSFTTALSRRPACNFFFQAEDFIRYIDHFEQMKQEAKEALREIDIEYADKSAFAKNQARGPHLDTLGSMSSMYANELMKISHGESFLEFFSSRLHPKGLYLLDEPEAALSYENQYVLALMVRESVRLDCQFIIATHSPVITAIPEAEVYQISQGQFTQVSYEEIDNVKFLNMFMKDRKRLFAQQFLELEIDSDV